MSRCSRLAIGLSLASLALADVSVYPLGPVPTPGVYKGYPAYDPTEIPVPQLAPFQSNQVPITLVTGAANVKNLGPTVPGSLLGISIEMSLSAVAVGLNKQVVWPQFLNLMETLKERGGPPHMRLGGNSQEKADFVDVLSDGEFVHKEQIGPTGITNTPTIFFTRDLLDTLKTVSDLTGVMWYMGIPMNQTNPARLKVMEMGEDILGDNIVTWQLGNEPDLYEQHHFRDPGYLPADYYNDVQTILTQIDADTSVARKTMIGGPSVCCLWNVDELISDGYIDKFRSHLNTFIVEHYPTDNCNKSAHDVNVEILSYTRHTAPVNFANAYRNTIQAATAAGLPVVLLETNTASCNGFLGISDAFTSALWALDLAMQLGSIGFQHMMLHMGGQGVYYNAFVPAPFNATAPYLWSIGPVMYSCLVSAEALGPSGNSRIVDLALPSDQMAGYAIYEGDVPVRALFINYLSNAAGSAASDYTVTLQAPGVTQVRQRNLIAPSTTSKQPPTYAGRTFGGQFEADGLLHGTDTTETIACTGGTCTITVKAPSAALVFLSDAAFSESVPEDSAVHTFETTYTSRRHSTATVEQVVLATSNGMSGKDRKQQSTTSFGSSASINGAGRGAVVGAATLGAALLFVASVVMM